MVENVEILLPAKFRWIPFSGFRGEVENVSANQRPGRPSCFSYRPEKHQLGRGHWDLASCQVSLNSVQRFQRRSRKCPSQSENRAAIFFFWSAPKTQTRKRTSRSCFLPSFVEFRSAVSEEKSKMSQPIRGQGGHLVFSIGPKKHKLLNVLYQVCVFRADRKNKMAALAADWLRHFLLLLRNRWTEFNETWQEARSQRPLPSLCFWGWSEKQDGRPVLWLAGTFSTSPLKPLNGIQWNLTGSKISMSSTKFVFFGPIGKARWPPWPLIGWDIFDFSSETNERNSTKLGRK